MISRYSPSAISCSSRVRASSLGWTNFVCGTLTKNAAYIINSWRVVLDRCCRFVVNLYNNIIIIPIVARHSAGSYTLYGIARGPRPLRCDWLLRAVETRSRAMLLFRLASRERRRLRTGFNNVICIAGRHGIGPSADPVKSPTESKVPYNRLKIGVPKETWVDEKR